MIYYDWCVDSSGDMNARSQHKTEVPMMRDTSILVDMKADKKYPFVVGFDSTPGLQLQMAALNKHGKWLSSSHNQERADLAN